MNSIVEVNKMRAKVLSDVYDIFDPQEALSGAKLREYYVARRDSPIENVADFLARSGKPIKYLFVGSRGNGKSTELNRLSEELKGKLFVISFSIKDKLNLFDVDYADILLVIAAEIYERVPELSREVKQYLDTWSEKIVEVVKEKQGGLDLGVGFRALVNIALKLKAQVTTREVTREVIKPRLSDLIDAINRIIIDAENKRELKKRELKILVIIDDLDKVNLEKGEELFYKHSAELTQPVCKIIYTIPQPLLFSKKIRQIILQYFDDRIELPNIKVYNKNGEIDDSGYEVMREVAAKRMENKLIADDALDEAIKSSGGILTDFMRIIRRAANIANVKDRSRIEKDDVVSAVAETRNDYIRILSKEDIELLKEVSNTKRGRDKAEDEDRFQDLLFCLAILQYSNGEEWYDIHPTIRGIIERIEAGEG